MLKLVTAPTVEPVTISEVKAFCGVTHDLDDALFGILISAQREHGESETALSWAEKTLELVLSGFPSGPIVLQAPPINAVLSVKYIDTDGVEQTVPESKYIVDKDSFPGFVKPVGEWPETSERTNAVKVRYTAGWWGDTFPIKAKLFLLNRVNTQYNQRESFVVGPNTKEMPRDFVIGLLDDMRLYWGL